MLDRAIRRRRRRGRIRGGEQGRRKTPDLQRDFIEILEKLVSVYGFNRRLFRSLSLPLQIPFDEVLSSLRLIIGGDITGVFTSFLSSFLTRSFLSSTPTTLTSSSSFSDLLGSSSLHGCRRDATQMFMEACLLLNRRDIAMNAFLMLPSIVSTPTVLLWTPSTEDNKKEDRCPPAASTQVDSSIPSSFSGGECPVDSCIERTSNASLSLSESSPFSPLRLSVLLIGETSILSPALRGGREKEDALRCLDPSFFSSSFPPSRVFAPREYYDISTTEKGSEEFVEDLSSSSRLASDKDKKRRKKDDEKKKKEERGFLSRWGGLAPEVTSWIRGVYDDNRLESIALALDPTAVRRIDVLLSSEAFSSLANTSASSMDASTSHLHGEEPSSFLLSLSEYTEDTEDEDEEQHHGVISPTAPLVDRQSFPNAVIDPSSSSSSSPLLNMDMMINGGDRAGEERTAARTLSSSSSSTSSSFLLEKLPPFDSAVAYAARDRGVALQQGLSLGRGALMLGSLLGEGGGGE